MKMIFKKILISLIIFVMLTQISCYFSINTGFCTVSYGEEATEGKSTVENAIQFASTTVGNVAEGIVGILLWKYKLLGIGAGTILQIFGASIASIAGTEDGIETFTPDSIFFNKYKITTIDFFDDADTSDIISTIKNNIALWYYIMVIIASVALLIILIYVGIRMAISTVASEKAKYKKMLQDWATSLALIFMLHFIIITTIKVNNSLVSIFEGIAKSDEAWKLDNIVAQLMALALHINLFISFGAIIVFIGLEILTFIFLIMYIKRMFTVAFLIIIAPLITITYSIDKMADQKAQALNNWLKEFMFNVLIQPFHCILYLAFTNMAISFVVGSSDGLTAESFISSNGSLGGIILAILALKFITTGEKIVKKIFGFDSASSLAGAMASAAIVANTLKQAQNIGSKGAELGKKYIAPNSFNKTLSNLPLTNRGKSQVSNFLTNIENRKNKRIEKEAKRMGERGDTRSFDERKKEASQNYESRKEKRRETAEKVLNNKQLQNGTAAVIGGISGMASYLASDDDADMINAAVMGVGSYKIAKGKMANWQKKRTSSYESESVANFKAAAKMTGENSDLTTEEGMANYKKYVEGTYRRGKYGDEFSSKSKEAATKGFNKAFEDVLNTSDINDLRAQLAMFLSADYAQDFDPRKLYDENNIKDKTGMEFEDFKKAIEPYVMYQLASNMYDYTDQFDTIMESRGLDHESAVQNVENNREKYNKEPQSARTTSTTTTNTTTNTTNTTTNNTTNNTNNEVTENTIIQSLGEGTIQSAIQGLNFEGNPDTSMEIALERMKKEIETKIDGLRSNIGIDDGISSPERFSEIENQVKTRIGESSSGPIDITGIGETDKERELATSIVNQHYLTEKREIIETHIKNNVKKVEEEE